MSITTRSLGRAAATLGTLGLALAAFAPGTAGADGTDGTDGTDDVDTRIIGGHAATEDYSFMVSLQQAGNHFCGGSLVDAEWVVTAAHCAGSPPADMKLRIGSKSTSAGGELVGVAEKVVHPDGAGNDIALLRLAKPAKAAPITIADSSGPAGTPTRVIGWGTTCDNGDCPPDTLQELDTKLVEDSRCTDIAGKKELCTDSDTPDAMACYGDSGGPQLQGKPGRWELIGATSRDGDQDPTCSTGTGIWTDVTAHADWIRQQIGG